MTFKSAPSYFFVCLFFALALCAGLIYKETLPTQNTPIGFSYGGFKTNIPVLVYHLISSLPASTPAWKKALNIEPENFDKQVSQLQSNGYTTLFASELENTNLQKDTTHKYLAITFDDGEEDLYTNMFPIIKNYNLKATVFVITARIGTKGYLTKNQLKEMAESGNIELGSHTVSHARLPFLNRLLAKYEIYQSKKVLESITGREILSFAYPLGFLDAKSVVLVAEAGYKTGFSLRNTNQQDFNSVYDIQRQVNDNRRITNFIMFVESIK